jgi:hypothetical protein
MAAPAGTDLILFVAGEPDTRIDAKRDLQLSYSQRVSGMFVPTSWFTGTRTKFAAPQDPEDHQELVYPWHLPREEILCVNLVLEVAEREGRNVTVVDVNRAAEHQDLVDRWVRVSDVLPLLVRPDGARLEGSENFVPRTIRHFMNPAKF